MECKGSEMFDQEKSFVHQPNIVKALRIDRFQPLKTGNGLQTEEMKELRRDHFQYS
jgi:hypothetical protein